MRLGMSELGLWTLNIGALIIFAVYIFIFALVIICLIRVSRYFLTAGKEQKLIRMEIGKLAEEVHLLRTEIKGGKDIHSSMQNG
jgi:hypothetical protein